MSGLYYETIRDENGTVIAIVDSKDDRIIDICCTLEEVLEKYPEAEPKYFYELVGEL